MSQEIPSELFNAVARVLAYVMALKSKGSAAGTHRNPHPQTMPEIARRKSARRAAAA